MRQTKVAVGVLISLVIGNAAQADVVTYPGFGSSTGTHSVRQSASYRVRVIQGGNAQDSFVNEITATKLVASRHNVCSFTTFSFDGAVEVEVTRLIGNSIQSCLVAPASSGVLPELTSSNIVRFRIEHTGCKLAVIFNDDWVTHPLLIFGDELERDAPRPEASRTKYFGPGVHDVGQITVTNGETVYLAGGAYVRGWIEGENVNDVTVRGRGIISAENRPERRGGLNKQTIYLNGDCTNLLVEGLTFVQSKGFSCTLRGASNIVRNCKVVGNWVPTTDGFVMDDHGIVEDCFIKANDDAIKLYGSHGVARRCVIWQMENGGVFQLGWTSQNASGCRVSDMDIIRTEWTTTDRNARGIIASVGLGGDGGGHVFENIRVERGGGRIISLNLKGNSSATCTNLLIRNLTVSNWSPVEGQIVGAGFSGIAFENFKLNDQWVESPEMAKINIQGGATGVRFVKTSP